jgi:hypothetical protein
MRFYIVEPSSARDRLFVVAEVVSYPAWSDARPGQLAREMASNVAVVVSAERLERMPGGREALDEWRASDDSEFEQHCLADLELAERTAEAEARRWRLVR